MNIVKREKSKNYTTISNVFLRDKNLSIKAKGFLAVIMSLPEDWEFTINGICSVLKEGRTAIYSAIQELKDCGYCNVDICRDEKGLITGNDYTFRESPKLEEQYNENPHAENLNADNETQRNKDETNNKTDEIKKGKEEKDKSFSKKESIDYDSIIYAWNEVANDVDEISSIRGLTDKRKKQIVSLLKTCNSTREELVRFIKTIPYADDWVIGKGDRKWSIDFDWLIQNTSNWYVAGLEGNMHKKNRYEFDKIMRGEEVFKQSKKLDGFQYL